MKTDIQLQQDVLAELKWDPKINAANVGVEVKNGVVTLSGHVDNYPEKWAAEPESDQDTAGSALVDCSRSAATRPKDCRCQDRQ
mgnify:CR=1 FL=1